MFLMILATAALAQAAPAQPAGPAIWTHDVPVAYGGGQAIARYSALPEINTRQVGMAAGARMSTVRCDWTADIGVERRLAYPGKATTGVRKLVGMKTLKGSRPGDCTINRRNIDRDIAAQADAINAHLVAVAEQDQRELRAEIETLAPPTGR